MTTCKCRECGREFTAQRSSARYCPEHKQAARKATWAAYRRRVDPEVGSPERKQARRDGLDKKLEWKSTQAARQGGHVKGYWVDGLLQVGLLGVYDRFPVSRPPSTRRGPEPPPRKLASDGFFGDAYLGFRDAAADAAAREALDEAGSPLCRVPWPVTRGDVSRFPWWELDDEEQEELWRFKHSPLPKGSEVDEACQPASPEAHRRDAQGVPRKTFDLGSGPPHTRFQPTQAMRELDKKRPPVPETFTCRVCGEQVDRRGGDVFKHPVSPQSRKAHAARLKREEEEVTEVQEAA